VEHGGSGLDYGGRRVKDSLLWALLTCAIAATTALIAFSIGSSLGGGDTGAAQKPASAPKTAAPAFLPTADIYASARADGYRAAADRAYAKGRKDGLREGRRAATRSFRRGVREALGPFADWETGRFYVVGIGAQRGAKQVGVVRREGPLREGRAYGVCRDGAALCESRRR
jgi:hypothetical protein